MARYDPHEFRDFLELSTREGHCQELDDIFLDPDLDRVQLEAKDGTEWKGDVPKGDVPKGGARSLLNALVLHMHRHAGIAPVAGTATNANRRPITCCQPSWTQDSKQPCLKTTRWKLLKINLAKQLGPWQGRPQCPWRKKWKTNIYKTNLRMLQVQIKPFEWHEAGSKCASKSATN